MAGRNYKAEIPSTLQKSGFYVTHSRLQTVRRPQRYVELSPPPNRVNRRDSGNGRVPFGSRYGTFNQGRNSSTNGEGGANASGNRSKYGNMMLRAIRRLKFWGHGKDEVKEVKPDEKAAEAGIEMKTFK